MPITGKNKEISLYFHIPFCKQKCPYCHFYAIKDKEESKKDLLNAFLLEWALYKRQFENKIIVSIYFGGGTPSLFGKTNFEILLKKIKSESNISSDCEITIEANPSDIFPENISSYSSLGINRISIGVQSLDDNLLKIIGRKHSAKKAIDSIFIAYNNGIKNISIDLMYDIPHQDMESWEKTLDLIEELPISHLSLYNLTFEPKTVFFRKKEILHPHLPNDDLSLNLLQTALERLKKMGLERYEISAFAKEKKRSLHNIGYWIARPFIGFGPSAFSYWENKRFKNVTNFKKYFLFLKNNKSPIDFEEELTYPENIIELFLINLRLVEGLDITNFESTYAPLPKTSKKILSSLIKEDFLKENNNWYSLSEKGLLFYDSIASLLV
jgi:oxygen-independent coproporphyrinogen-3 oxidase